MSAAMMEKPKRPLSAYNLFYRFKRGKILLANEAGDNTPETVDRLIYAVPGTEDHPDTDLSSLSTDDANAFRRDEIRGDLCTQLSPKDSSKRSHRKSHGAFSFLEMNKMMCAAWKAIDDFTRNVFEELANEGRAVYRRKVAEYEKWCDVNGIDPSASRKDGGKDNKGGDAPKSPLKRKVSSVEGDDAAMAAVAPAGAGGPGEDLRRRPSTPDPFLPAEAKSSSAAAATASPTKKSSKDAERPKRPLSSYNLFYRFKRNKVQEAHSSGDYSVATSERIITAVVGLEEYPFLVDKVDSHDVKNLRRDKIRGMLAENLGPKDTSKRSHRKNHANGTMSFLEMNRVMCASWKAIDQYARDVFEELAEEGRRVYEAKVAEYQERQERRTSFRSDDRSSVTIGPPKTKKVKVEPKAKPAPIAVVTPVSKYAQPKPRVCLPRTVSSISSICEEEFSVPFGAPTAASRRPRNAVTPTTPTSSADSSIFDEIDLENDPLPVFPDIFEVDEAELEKSVHDSIDAEFSNGAMGMDCYDDLVGDVSDSSTVASSVNSSGVNSPPAQVKSECGYPKLPFAEEARMGAALAKPALERKTSVDDFMKLIATLDESICEREVVSARSA